MTDPAIPDAVDERLEQLEARFLYQDRTIDELNAIVTRQQDQIDALLAQVERLTELVGNPPDEGIDAGEEPPPPHY